MDKKQVAEYFDSLADVWDINMIKIQPKIDEILDRAGVTEGKYVLDVACGTGVLIPDYVKRKVSKCVAIDISDKMIEKAKSKFSQYENVEFLCGDAEVFDFILLETGNLWRGFSLEGTLSYFYFKFWFQYKKGDKGRAPEVSHGQ